MIPEPTQGKSRRRTEREGGERSFGLFHLHTSTMVHARLMASKRKKEPYPLDYGKVLYRRKSTSSLSNRPGSPR